jgi:D-glycero-D-manno-heptose 1,7-bisphosphate phosphatase
MKLVVLDRDGVINLDSDDFIKSADEWVPIPGSLEAIARLCRAEFRVVVITNQSGIARGLLDIDTLNRIHQRMMARLHDKGGRIDAIFFCPHGPDDGCRCRKPATGLFDDLARRANVTLAGVPAVGDSVRDLVAANAVGALPVLVKTGKGMFTLEALNDPERARGLEHVAVYKDLAAFTDDLLDGGLERQISERREAWASAD